MINSIFKFLPCRAEFFDNYLLRASNRSALNDPFEATPSYEFWASFCLQTGYTRFGETQDEIISFLEVQPRSSVWTELGITFFRENGIISFTETKNNLLMWSHYADYEFQNSPVPKTPPPRRTSNKKKPNPAELNLAFFKYKSIYQELQKPAQ